MRLKPFERISLDEHIQIREHARDGDGVYQAAAVASGPDGAGDQAADQAVCRGVQVRNLERSTAWRVPGPTTPKYTGRVRSIKPRAAFAEPVGTCQA